MRGKIVNKNSRHDVADCSCLMKCDLLPAHHSKESLVDLWIDEKNKGKRHFQVRPSKLCWITEFESLTFLLHLGSYFHFRQEIGSLPGFYFHLPLQQNWTFDFLELYCLREKSVANIVMQTHTKQSWFTFCKAFRGILTCRMNTQMP